MALHLFCLSFPCTLQTLPEVLPRISHHPQLFSCIVVPKQATLPHFPGCRIYFMGARQAGTKVARWQNLIPSFPWIAPGLEGVGAQSKERKGSKFAAQHSGAKVLQAQRAKHIRSKNLAKAIWQPCLEIGSDPRCRSRRSRSA